MDLLIEVDKYVVLNTKLNEWEHCAEIVEAKLQNASFSAKGQNTSYGKIAKYSYVQKPTWLLCSIY